MSNDEDWSREIDGEDDEPMPEISEVELRKIFGESPNATLILNSPETMEHFVIVAGPRKSWLWCLHCERAYPLGSYRLVEDLQMCPYSECRGDTVLDLWAWQKIREDNPHYPEIPELGIVYPLYGER